MSPAQGGAGLSVDTQGVHAEAGLLEQAASVLRGLALGRLLQEAGGAVPGGRLGLACSHGAHVLDAAARGASDGAAASARAWRAAARRYEDTETALVVGRGGQR